MMLMVARAIIRQTLVVIDHKTAACKALDAAEGTNNASPQIDNQVWLGHNGTDYRL